MRIVIYTYVPQWKDQASQLTSSFGSLQFLEFSPCGTMKTIMELDLGSDQDQNRKLRNDPSPKRSLPASSRLGTSHTDTETKKVFKLTKLKPSRAADTKDNK